jgi:hypothetical protein
MEEKEVKAYLQVQFPQNGETIEEFWEYLVSRQDIVSLFFLLPGVENEQTLYRQLFIAFQHGWLQRLIMVELDRLVLADWNYKEDDDYKAQQLLENMKNGGQVENIQIREFLPEEIVARSAVEGKYEIVNGNHRLPAFQGAGMTHALCYNFGQISKDQATLKSMELNFTRFPDNPYSLARSLQEIFSSLTYEQAMKTLPFTPDEAKRYLQVLDFDWNKFTDGDDSYWGSMTEPLGRQDEGSPDLLYVTIFYETDEQRAFLEELLQMKLSSPHSELQFEDVEKAQKEDDSHEKT